MRARDVRELSDAELDAKRHELTESLFHFRLRRGVNQLESPGAMRQARRDLARVKTVLRQREIQGRGETS